MSLLIKCCITLNQVINKCIIFRYREESGEYRYYYYYYYYYYDFLINCSKGSYEAKFELNTESLDFEYISIPFHQFKVNYLGNFGVN